MATPLPRARRLDEAPPLPVSGARRFLRRVLWAVGLGGAFVLLAALGLGVASLFSPGDPSPEQPEPVRAPPRAAAPEPPLPPPPPPAVAASPSPPPAAPPVQAVSPPPQAPVIPGVLPLPARLELRRDVISGLTALRNEIARCPSEPVRRSTLAAHAALVLDAVTEGDTVRLIGSSLEADVPVNDGFVSCVRGVLQGKTFPSAGAAAAARLRIFVPLGVAGNALSLGALSLTEAESQSPR